MPNKIRVLSLFGGIGCFEMGLERANIPFEVVDYVDNDKFAVKSYNAIWGTNYEPQDIRKWDKDIECDLICHGSPCQSFSVAGLGAGGDEGSGTRSSLMWETVRIVEKIRPKYIIWENVKGLLTKKHRHNFDAYLKTMENLGYKNYYQIMNAKNYGTPQNRERVFTVSIREDVDRSFKFPNPTPLDKKLKDILEKEVDEKYYLSDKTIAGFVRHSERHKTKGNGFRFEPTSGESSTHTVTSRVGQRSTNNFIKEVGKLNIKGHDQIKRVYSSEGVAPTLTTMEGGNRQPKILENDELQFVGGIGEKDIAGDGKKLSRNYPQGNRVYSTEGIAASLTANGGGLGGKTGLYMEEPFIVASRGRNPNNPSDRTSSSPTVQKLEPKFDGTTNTITTVQKDNYVVVGDNEKPIKEVPSIIQKQGDRGTNNYSVNSETSYTIPANPMSDRGQMVVEKNLKTQLCDRLVKEGVVQGGEVINHSYTTRPDILGYVENNPVRIRKLTPRECWRLQSIDDEKFDKAKKAGVSDTQLYKQAGNGIAVCCPAAIFSQLFML